MFFYTNKNQSRQIRHQSLKVNYEHTFKSSFWKKRACLSFCVCALLHFCTCLYIVHNRNVFAVKFKIFFCWNENFDWLLITLSFFLSFFRNVFEFFHKFCFFQQNFVANVLKTFLEAPDMKFENWFLTEFSQFVMMADWLTTKINIRFSFFNRWRYSWHVDGILQPPQSRKDRTRMPGKDHTLD